jgi:RNA polymerase sigma-32 factor
MGFKSRSSFDLRACLPMTRAEEEECARQYVQTKAPLLAERLITANMRLVVTIARRYRRGTFDLFDLVQEGNLGLIHAVTRYDPDRGVRLCSYAAWWIRAYILRFTISNWRLVRAGTNQAQRKLFFNLQKQRARLERDGIQADAKQLAAALDVREKDVVVMLEKFAGPEASLEAAAPEGRALAHSLSAPSALRPDVRLETSQHADLLKSKLSAFGDTLAGRESDIFWQRLLCDEPVTLGVLAARFGVTRERTRQLELQLKVRIRNYLARELGDVLEPDGALA